MSELDDVRRLRSYAYRVARYVLRERLGRQAAPTGAGGRSPEGTGAPKGHATGFTPGACRPTAPRVAAPGGAHDRERRVGCLARCLSALAGEERDLVVAYYRTSGRDVEDRFGLAGRLGLTRAALRTRAYRLRLRLEMCLGGCLQRREDR